MRLERSPKKIIREKRAKKQQAREEEIELRGRRGVELNEINDEIDNCLDRELAEHQDWVDSKFADLQDYLGDVSKEEVMDSFRKSLGIAFKQEYRLFKKTDPQRIDQLLNKRYIQEVIFGFAFDYIRSLRRSMKRGEAIGRALQLAELSHRYNHDVLINLQNKFPDFNASVIKHAAVHNPADPEGFLKRAQEAIPQLQEKFPDFDVWVIKHAAVNNPADPEGFLKRVQKRILDLHKKFPDLPSYLIKYAAVLEPTDPEGFLEDSERWPKRSELQKLLR